MKGEGVPTVEPYPLSLLFKRLIVFMITSETSRVLKTMENFRMCKTKGKSFDMIGSLGPFVSANDRTFY